MSVQTKTSSKAYDLLIHSLAHEHNQDNIDRHVLLLEKWCRDCNLGLFVRDLEYILQVLSILKQRLDRYPDTFTAVAQNVLKLCSKALLETKSNERLSPRSIELISAFYYSLCSLWTMSTATNIIDCFLTILRNDNDNDNDANVRSIDKTQITSIPITDKVFINNLMKQSKAFDFLVDKYLECIDSYIDAKELYSIKSMNLSSLSPASQYTDDNKAGDVNYSIDNDAPHSLSNDPVFDSKQVMHKMYEINCMFLNLCLDLCHLDSRNTLLLVQTGLCNGLLTILQDIATSISIRERAVSDLVFLLWLCLESFTDFIKPNSRDDRKPEFEEEIAVLSSNKTIVNVSFAVSVIKQVLELLIDQGYREVDKECRNEVIIVLTLTTQLYPVESIHHIINTGLFDILLTLSCVGEQQSQDFWLFIPKNLKLRNFSSNSDIDMQLKRLLWSLFSKLINIDKDRRSRSSYDSDSDLDVSSFNDLLTGVAASPLLETMMMYLEANSLDKQIFNKSVNSINPNNQTTSNDNDDLNGLSDDPMNSSNTDLYTTMYKHQSVSLSTSAAANKDNKLLKSLSISSLRQFQVLASNFIVSYASKILGEFLRISGPLRVLKIIDFYSKASGRIYEYQEIIAYLLMSLNQCVINSEVCKSILTANQAIFQLLEVYELFVSMNDLNPSEMVENINVQCIRLVTLLCQDSTYNQEQFRSHKGIQLLLATIAKYSKDKKPLIIGYTENKLQNQVGTTNNSTNKAGQSVSETSSSIELLRQEMNQLIISIIDCFRIAVINNQVNEITLAVSEGIDILLELLEVSSFPMRIQIYRLLSDLLEKHVYTDHQANVPSIYDSFNGNFFNLTINNMKTVDYSSEERKVDKETVNHKHQLLSFFHSWRSSKTMRSAAQLICHGWIDEEYRLNCYRDMNGIICNLFDPLGHQNWPTDISIDFTVESLSVASLAVDSMKPISQTVSKLATAIATAAKHASIQPSHTEMISLYDRIKKHVLFTFDSRCILANLLQLLNLCSDHNEDNVLEVEGKSNHLRTDLIVSPFDRRPQPAQNYQSTTRDNYQFTNKSSRFNETNEDLDKFESFGDTETDKLMIPSEVTTSKTNLGITCKERQVIAMAKEYYHLRCNEWWDTVISNLVVSMPVMVKRNGRAAANRQDGMSDVTMEGIGISHDAEVADEREEAVTGVDMTAVDDQNDFTHENFQPIESDVCMVELYREQAFNAVIKVQFEQMMLKEHDTTQRKRQEYKYYNHLIDLKLQEVKSNELKKRSAGFSPSLKALQSQLKDSKKK